MATPVLVADMTDEEFERHTLAILSRELGLVGYVRFLRSFRAGGDDYTADRKGWLDNQRCTLMAYKADIGS